MNIFDGLRIIEDASLVDVTEDWSRVRAPSRAERRRRQGHRQNIKIFHKPKSDCFVFDNTIVMHPEIAVKIRAATTPGLPPPASVCGPGNLRGGAAASPLFTPYFFGPTFVRSSSFFKVSPT
jgi:hypothetical protein